ncbi:MAG: 23S rRNA (adenine(2503)-C(2))-methyltransferase RlmN [Balneolaceae bacterium]|nr:MAG: 23S rRNA (adenine(2503)-C(2))-methyltransferase RlmN [Balneolaceae bacterium]
MSENVVTKQLPADLKTFTFDELRAFCTEKLNLPRFRSDQLFQWIYQKQASSFEEMTNLPADLRVRLAELAVLHKAECVKEQRSADGTIKALFELHDGHRVEAVLIPEFFDDGVADRLTVCISSQVGCMFGCSFCATGMMGYFRNLSIGEIADQAIHMDAIARETFGKRINNIVYMGMGEPLHNYKAVMHSAAAICHKLGLGLSPKRITISTVGLTKQIRQMADENQPYRLAISLHAASDDKRNRIMPINESLDLKSLEEAVRYYHQKTEKDLTYEYLLFDEFNDTKEDAALLARIAGWAPSKVNIIMYNNVAGVTLQRAREHRLNSFLAELTKRRVLATVRRSRGDDIDAGCGQLAIREGAEIGKTIAGKKG